MKRLIVRYKVKPDRASENQQYVEKVFEELRQNSPPGLRYATFKQNDGVTFLHLVSIEADVNPLPNLPAFQAFQAGIKERCEEQPIVTDLEEVGSYHFFDN
jgi:quinol monooxygenase YgiN